jgi:hypothetical protein
MLPVEVLFAIFKLLDRPGKLSLGMTGPHFLHLLARYYDLDRYRDDQVKWKKIGIPAGVSWDDSAAQPAIIRWLAASGCDDIDNPPEADQSEEEEEDPSLSLNNFGAYHTFGEQEVPLSYEESELGLEDAMVESIISAWLRAKFNIKGGCVICAECYRYMLVLGPDGNITSWSENMLSRPG